MPVTLTASGFFKSINKYNQLIISLDDTTKIKSLTADWKGNSPLYEYEYNEKAKNTLKVALEPRDKNVAKRFNAIADMTGKMVEFKVELKQYDFTNKEMERIIGWKANLITMKRVEKEAPFSHPDDWVPPPELLKRQ